MDWTGQRSAAHLELTGPVDESEVWVTAGRRRRVEGPKAPDATNFNTTVDEAERSIPSRMNGAEEKTVYGPPELLLSWQQPRPGWPILPASWTSPLRRPR